jgi:type IV pilus assembly protein PilB
MMMSTSESARNQPRSQFERRLCEYFMQKNLLDVRTIDAVLLQAEQAQKTLEVLLVQQELITEEQLSAFLSETFNVRVIKVADIPKPTMELLETLPEELMEDKRVIPVTNSNGRLVVAMVDPGDRGTLNEITFLTGIRPQVVAVTEMEFWKWWELYQRQQLVRARGSSEKKEALMADLKKAHKEKYEKEGGGNSSTVLLDLIKQQGEAEIADESSPLVRFVTSLIMQGIEQEASDIHIEPRTDKYIIRFRMDGVLKHVLDIPSSMETAVITRLKVMSKMDIADHRRPQDGRITINYKRTAYNLRVNTLPVTDGREKIVMRILRPSKHIPTYAKLGFSEEDQANLHLLAKSPYGIVLVCGPTGSGKSTTLYTVLNQINEDIINVSTVEDPVELKMEGLNQSQVNPKSDFTFASSMRALLRQDPDVIMVGEIRDYETLEAAIHAALTGHLVFSTIHANSSATTITRMLEMGASASLVSAALNGVVAQRLVRTLCPQCKVPYEAPVSEKEVLFNRQPHKVHEPLTLYKSKGCPSCKESGYWGRAGLYEMMMVNRTIRQLIAAQANDLEIEDAAIENGMLTLLDCAKDKIVKGMVDFAEVERVLGVIRQVAVAHTLSA